MFNKFDNQKGGNFGPRQMVQGNWKCSDCGKEITEMPFEPDPARKIYCRECWQKNKPPRFNR